MDFTDTKGEHVCDSLVLKKDGCFKRKAVDKEQEISCTNADSCISAHWHTKKATYTYLLSSLVRHQPAPSSSVICSISLVSNQQDTHEAFISRHRLSSMPFTVTCTIPWLSLGHRDILLMNDRAGTFSASPFDPLVGLIVCNASVMPHPTPAGPWAVTARPGGYRGQLFPFC